VTSVKPLPPYGREYLALDPDPGMRVACGAGAWGFARNAKAVIMVLPPDATPDAYRWPNRSAPALVHEVGPPDDERLTALARQLLLAGASSVVALRHSLAQSGRDPRVFFEAVRRAA